MLSSFGFDKGVARRAAPNNSKYVLEVPRGFSVHVFKNPPPPPGFPSTGKPDYPQNRDIANANWTTKPPSSYSSRPELERKQASNPVETRTSQLSAYARVFEPKRPKQQRPYGIYPSAIPDTYIYERSVSSASDVLSSDSSSTSSDSDVNPDIAEFAIEVSSTRASSSTETLETTALDIPAILPSSRPVRSSPSPPSPSQAPVTAATRPTRSPSQSPQTPSYSSAPHTSRRATVEDAFDSDSETVISDGPGAPGFTTSHSQPPTSTGPPRGLGASLPLSTPIRRGSDDSVTRVGNIPPSNVAQAGFRPSGPSSPVYDESILRAPPGLQSSTSSSRPTPSRSSTGNSSRSNIIPEPPRVGPSLDQTAPLASTAKRSVRWTENLVCPSPVPFSSRRRGWYNRRGDQLWTNDGKFKSPEAGQEYPADLSGYPEPKCRVDERGRRAHWTCNTVSFRSLPSLCT